MCSETQVQARRRTARLFDTMHMASAGVVRGNSVVIKGAEMPAPAYRPDIDGLRAVAVVFVLIFHAFPSVLPGGFIGVDVFFVISGFLITGIIVRQLGTGSFTLSGFYFRRMRRIFPTLIVVLLATMTLGWFFFLPNEFVSLGKNVLAGALFFPNLMLLSEVGYFDVAAQLKPLLHLWSLGIEEQYYLAFPLFLMCFWRRRFMVWGVVVIALGSFALSVLLTKSNPSAAFYLPFTRAWELMIGALIALVPRLVVNSNLRSTLGCVLIGAAAFLLDPKTPYPGWAALLPTLGAALLIAAEGSMLNRALALRPVVFVGLISYPLYLWHWPLLSFFGILDEQPSALARGGILLASAALAYLTYRYIETPVRRASDRFMFPKMAGFSGAMLAACMCGAFIVYTGGYPPRLSSQIASAGILNPSFDGLQKSACLVNSNATTEFPPECIDDDTSKPLVLLWGDSTAGALAPGFRNLQQRIPFRFGQLVTSSCWPIVGYRRPELQADERQGAFDHQGTKARGCHSRRDMGHRLRGHRTHGRNDQGARCAQGDRAGSPPGLEPGPANVLPKIPSASRRTHAGQAAQVAGRFRLD